MALSALLQMLLHQVAGDKLRQAAFDALRGNRQNNASHDSKTAPRQLPNPPPANSLPCHAGLVFALNLEAAPLVQRLSGVVDIRAADLTVQYGGLHGRGLATVVGGVGRVKAAAATQLLIDGHKPAWIISAGLAGGLSPQLKRGDLMLPTAIVGTTGERLEIDLHISAEQLATTPGLHTGSLFTSDEIVFKPTDKRALGERHGALAVDMETLAVAEVCRREKQRFLAVRIISDAVDDELPAHVERLLTRNTTAKKIGAAAGSLLRRPSTAKDLWNLWQTTNTCADKLAKFLEGIIAQLP